MSSARQAVEDVVAIHLEAVRLQREADAALVEAAGCICWALTAIPEAGVEVERRPSPRILRHAPQCPSALAAKIRGQA